VVASASYVWGGAVTALWAIVGVLLWRNPAWFDGHSAISSPGARLYLMALSGILVALGLLGLALG
jgi:hypothetical protein